MVAAFGDGPDSPAVDVPLPSLGRLILSPLTYYCAYQPRNALSSRERGRALAPQSVGASRRSLRIAESP